MYMVCHVHLVRAKCIYALAINGIYTQYCNSVLAKYFRINSYISAMQEFWASGSDPTVYTRQCTW